MSRPISAESKDTMRANLELEITSRKENLLAMCEAQCASLRSRLERRVNRVPSTKRSITLIDILEPPSLEAPPAKKAKEIEPAPAPAPAATRRARAAPAKAVATQPTAAKQTTKAASKAATKSTTKAAPKATRGVKRPSENISGDDKENNAELSVPKKRAKATAAAPAPRATRATRAASKKIDPAPQVLSPKPNNARPATATRTRRAR